MSPNARDPDADAPAVPSTEEPGTDLELYQDPALYDEQYAGYRDDLPFYRGLVRDYGGPVLELGAGTGRLSAALASSGAKVVAVDASEPMLAAARGHLAAARLAQNVELVRADMRSLELGRTFPLVLAPFNTLMHAYTPRDQDRTLATVRRHLACGGAFAFDLYLPRLGPLGVLRRETEWADVGGGHSELFLVQHHDPVNQMVESRYLLDRVAADGVVRRRTARVLQRYYTRFELLRALQLAGLGRVRFFGGFDRCRLDERSAVLVGIAGVP